jgi:curved DNA-binding protein CbpA
MSNIEELINQMNPKKDVEEIKFNRKPTDEKFKTTVKETTFDYYKILGVAPTATSSEIKRAYQAKLKKLHPDKIEQTKENIAKYKLLREAGDILTDQYERKAYDATLKMNVETKDFASSKGSFKDFLKLQEQNMTDEDRTIAKLNFERGLADMDRRHGFSKRDMEAMTKDEHDRRVEDLKLQREQESLEISHENPFEGRSFVPSEFNKLFEKKKKRDEKRKQSKGELAKCEDITAFNDFEEGSGGVGLEHYNDLYTEGRYTGYNEHFAGVGGQMVGEENGQSEDDQSIDSPDEDYDTHNKQNTKESLDQAMKRMMAERSGHDLTIKEMQPTEYGSVLDDKFGISSQFGFVVGNDKFGHQKNLKKIDVKEETLKAYKELTQ